MIDELNHEDANEMKQMKTCNVFFLLKRQRKVNLLKIKKPSTRCTTFANT